MITRCGSCPHYAPKRLIFVARPPAQSPTEGECRKARRAINDSDKQPDWCPLPEEDPNST